MSLFRCPVLHAQQHVSGQLVPVLLKTLGKKSRAGCLYVPPGPFFPFPPCSVSLEAGLGGPHHLVSCPPRLPVGFCQWGAPQMGEGIPPTLSLCSCQGHSSPRAALSPVLTLLGSTCLPCASRPRWEEQLTCGASPGYCTCPRISLFPAHFFANDPFAIPPELFHVSMLSFSSWDPVSPQTTLTHTHQRWFLHQSSCRGEKVWPFQG